AISDTPRRVFCIDLSLHRGHTVPILSPEPVQYVDIASHHVSADLPLETVFCKPYSVNLSFAFGRSCNHPRQFMVVFETHTKQHVWQALSYYWQTKFYPVNILSGNFAWSI